MYEMGRKSDFLAGLKRIHTLFMSLSSSFLIGSVSLKNIKALFSIDFGSRNEKFKQNSLRL